MNQVWILTHTHEFDDGHEDLKIIGVFSTQALAEVALSQVKDKQGFSDLPEGFDISPCTLDLISWTEGFVTIEP